MSIRRIVVKAGTAVLTRTDGQIEGRRIGRLAAQIASIRGGRIQVVVVTSGAIAAGLSPLGLSRRPSDLPSLQAAAAVGQRRLMDSYARALARFELEAAQVLLTRAEVVDRRSYVSARRTIERLLDLGAVPVVNENDTVATDEIRYGDNDILAALVANLVGADLLVLLTDVEGLFTRNPRRGRAELIPKVDEVTPELMRLARGRSDRGSGGMSSKLEAARMASWSGIPAVLADGRKDGVLERVVEGEQVGTFFEASRRRMSARKLWIALVSEPSGSIEVDDGAVDALVSSSVSLLAAGVSSVKGDFEPGETVEVRDGRGKVFARGSVAFGARDLAELAGSRGGREVIHRDQLVIL